MNMKQENEIISNDEVNLYDYWKVLVKRKEIFLGIFLIPLIIVMVISFIMPRYYRGESEITIPAFLAITAPNIVNLVGNIDEAKKDKIFAGNSSAIKNVIISIPKKSTDKVRIIVESKSPDIIHQAFKDVFNYISNLPEIKDEIARIKEENDLKLKKLAEVKRQNLIFLNQITDMIKKRQLMIININPADLVKKDNDLSQEIMNIQRVKVTAGKLGPPMLAKQPSNAQIKQIIVITVIISLMAGLFVVFFLDYIERMKARENK